MADVIRARDVRPMRPRSLPADEDLPRRTERRALPEPEEPDEEDVEEPDWELERWVREGKC
jgi:hypothetical protein